MLFGQLARCDSQWEICHGLHTLNGKLSHLGIPEAPRKSTLAYANEHLPWAVYRSVFFPIRRQCEEIARLQKRKFRFHNPIESMEIKLIPVCLSIFDLAHCRRSKGAIKLHELFSHEGYLPKWAIATTGKTQGVKVLITLVFPPNTIVLIDRGYKDDQILAEWTRRKVFFVTRMKDNATYRVLRRAPVPKLGNIQYDDIIEFTVFYSRMKCSLPLRRTV